MTDRRVLSHLDKYTKWHRLPNVLTRLGFLTQIYVRHVYNMGLQTYLRKPAKLTIAHALAASYNALIFNTYRLIMFIFASF